MRQTTPIPNRWRPKSDPFRPRFQLWSRLPRATLPQGFHLHRSTLTKTLFFLQGLLMFSLTMASDGTPPQLRQTLQCFRTSHSLWRSWMVRTTPLRHLTSLCGLVGLAINLISLLQLNPYPRLNLHNRKISIVSYAVLLGPFSTSLSNQFPGPTTPMNLFGVRHVLSTQLMLNGYTVCVETWWPS